MAATAMGLALQSGEASGATGGFGPRADGEAVTYRLTSTESSARGTWTTTGTFRVEQLAGGDVEIEDARDRANAVRVERRPDGAIAPLPGQVGDFIYAYNQTVAAFNAAAALRPGTGETRLRWRVGPPGMTIAATATRESETDLEIHGSGPLEPPAPGSMPRGPAIPPPPGPPPAARISVHFAAHVQPGRITTVSEEALEIGPRDETIAHHWMLEQDRGA
jgi:hypothetical protein